MISAESGSTTCEICKAGSSTEGVTSATQCVDCSPGTYSDLDGFSSCSQCPVGTYSASAGTVHCDKCPAGKIGTTKGITVCNNCDVGKYSVGGTDTCSDCAWGTYAAETGMPECLSARWAKLKMRLGSQNATIAPQVSSRMTLVCTRAECLLLVSSLRRGRETQISAPVVQSVPREGAPSAPAVVKALTLQP